MPAQASPGSGPVCWWCWATWWLSTFCLLALQSIPVGIAYAIWAGLGIVLISLAGWIFFGQKLDLASVLGMILIIAGVMVINLFSKVTA